MTERFRVSGKITKLLGRESVADPVTALFEVIKNSHDADALSASVKFQDFEKNQGKIIIKEKKGDGMKYNDIKLYFGDTPKPIDNLTKYEDNSIDVGVIQQKKNRSSELAWIPTQLRLPEIGEEVAAIGYPTLPQRDSTLVMHVGIVEALPVTLTLAQRLIQVSFHSGGGLSGGCLIDKRGFVIGIMTENIYNITKHKPPENAPEKEELIGKDGFIVGVESNIAYNKIEIEIPSRPYGQAIPVEYLADKLYEFTKNL